VNICGPGKEKRPVQFYYICGIILFFSEFQALSEADNCKSKYFHSVTGPRIKNNKSRTCLKKRSNISSIKPNLHTSASQVQGLKTVRSKGFV
jgi:hypothetical protein